MQDEPCNGAACAAAQVILHSFLECLKEACLWPWTAFENKSTGGLRIKMQFFVLAPAKPIHGFACRKKWKCVAHQEHAWPKVEKTLRAGARAALDDLEDLAHTVGEDGRIDWLG